MCGWKQWVEWSKVVKLINNTMRIQLTNIYSENKYKHSTSPDEESLLAVLTTKSVTMIRDGMRWLLLQQSSPSAEQPLSALSKKQPVQDNRLLAEHCPLAIHTFTVCTACRTNLTRYSVMVLRWTDGTLLWDGQIPWGRKTDQLQGKARLLEKAINA